MKKIIVILISLAVIGFAYDFAYQTINPEGYALEQQYKEEQKQLAIAERKAKEENEKIQKAERQRLAKVKADADAQKGFHCLSGWDGSHSGLKRAVKNAVRDPKSFEHIKTLVWPKSPTGTHTVAMTYRAKNGFGGYVVEKQSAVISHYDCSIINFI